MALRLALLGDVQGEVVSALAAAGLAVVSALADDPFSLVPRSPEQPLPRSYAGLAEVVEAARSRAIDAAVLPPGSPLAEDLPALREAGLPLLLPEPAPWDAELLRQSRTPDDVGLAVLLRERFAPWALAVHEVTAGAAPPVQITVRGWPRGPVAAAELVDLVRRWCGDVVAVAAAPAPLPAGALPDGPRLVWALLTDSGCTVLVAHEGPAQSVRLSYPHARLLADPRSVAWQDGPVLRLPGATALPDPTGRHDAVPPSDPLAATCRAFATAVREGTSEPLGAGRTPWPWPADLADLQPLARVLAALRESARQERWVELG